MTLSTKLWTLSSQDKFILMTHFQLYFIFLTQLEPKLSLF